MSSNFSRTIVFSLLTGLLILCTGTPAFALSKIGLTVRTVSIPQPRDTGKKKTAVKKDIDKRKIEVTLKNASSAAATGLEIHYYFIGKDADKPEMKILDSDTKTQDLAAGALGVVASKVASATYTPSYTTKPKKNSGDKAEHVDADGEKFLGWAVQVFSGSELVAEAYSSPVLKNLMPAPAASNPAAAAKPTP